MSNADHSLEPLIDSGEAAKLLQICPRTVLRMARLGKIPAFRIGRLWRFRKSTLDEWAVEKLASQYRPCREKGKE